MRFTIEPRGVCPRAIEFDNTGDVITGIRFVGGCNGNLKMISKLVDGWTVDQIEETLGGNTCGYKPTSCADQLARAVRLSSEQMKRVEAEAKGSRPETDAAAGAE